MKNQKLCLEKLGSAKSGGREKRDLWKWDGESEWKRKEEESSKWRLSDISWEMKWNETDQLR